MKKNNIEWVIVGILGIVAFGLAYTGFQIHFDRQGVDRNALDLVFMSIKLFTAEFVDEFTSPLPWQLEAARWLAPGVFLYAAAKALLYLIRREWKSLRARFFRDHIIVSSLNEASRSLVEDFLSQGEKVIVLTEPTQPQVWDPLEEQGALFLSGDLTNPWFLKRIAAHRAKYFMLMDEDDAQNIAQAIFLQRYLTRRRGRERKYVLFTHVANEIKLDELIVLKFFQPSAAANRNCEVRVFSVYERTSRLLFNQYGPDVFAPIQPGSSPVRVAIFGSGPLAQSMVLRLARLGHYVNFLPMKVTWFQETSLPALHLLQNFPALGQILDLESVEEPATLLDPGAFQNLHEQMPFRVIYLLCEDEDASANILKKLTYLRTEEPLEVVVSLTKPKGILAQWPGAERLESLNVHLFNQVAETFNREALVLEPLDNLARIIHQEYLNSLKVRNSEKNTHQEWEYLAVDAQNQNRDQADHMYVKLRAVGCEAVPVAVAREKGVSYEEDPVWVERLSKMEHNRWWASKLLAGWTYGTQEDAKRMLHPNLVEYEALDSPTQDWDRLAVRQIRPLLNKQNYKIVKWIPSQPWNSLNKK